MINRKRLVLTLCILLALAISPSGICEQAGPDQATQNQLGFMFGVIGDYLQDGGSEPLTRFDAAVRAPDEFYGGVMFFYVFNNGLAADVLGDKAILPVESLDEGMHILDTAQAQSLFVSFFGDAYLPELESILSDYAISEGRYGFGMSDGPSPTATIQSCEVMADGKLSLRVQVAMDGEAGIIPVGVFESTLTPSDASIFGYLIEAFSFQRA